MTIKEQQALLDKIDDLIEEFQAASMALGNAAEAFGASAGNDRNLSSHLECCNFRVMFEKANLRSEILGMILRRIPR